MFLPFAALAFTEAGRDLPVLQGRPGDGRGYMCLHRTCDLPTTDPGVFRAQLERVAAGGQ